MITVTHNIPSFARSRLVEIGLHQLLLQFRRAIVKQVSQSTKDTATKYWVLLKVKNDTIGTTQRIIAEMITTLN